jgi:hypothetical protein
MIDSSSSLLNLPSAREQEGQGSLSCICLPPASVPPVRDRRRPGVHNPAMARQFLMSGWLTCNLSAALAPWYDCMMGLAPGPGLASHGGLSGLYGLPSTFLVEISQPFRWSRTSEAWLRVAAVAALGDWTADPTGPIRRALRQEPSSQSRTGRLVARQVVDEDATSTSAEHHPVYHRGRGSGTSRRAHSRAASAFLCA